LMARLDATGMWDRSLVVLVADHGVAFAPSSPRRKVTQGDVGGIAPVPFFVKLPRARQGRIVDDHVETIDVLPTIADALDIRLPQRPDGRSALAADYRGHDGMRIWSTTSTREFRRVDVPWPLFLTRRAAVVAQQASLFGTGDDSPELLWEVGPNRDVVGRRLEADAEARAPVVGSVRYDRPEELEAWTRSARWSPAHVSGELDGVAPGTELMLVVGGRVAAVTRAYEFQGDTRFSFMAHEGLFREGYNDVRAFTLDRSNDGFRIQRLSG
ncbi:MAG TPA: hypothetical protein VNB64_09705, partial [Solirubrobacteraceae bacterium]|nr:hypothetical protein [Solirubrobacteraceae bacterium]